ncbi:MAG: DUF4920 domain-containing protein [Mangrovimonas sp.]|nr:DUF4920 domain-containing protein [Mangrovimonas sp.]MCB0426440.1 DUF4920 domain-containing protein [Mangrovimonas sp.]
MKKVVLLALLFCAFFACKNETKTETVEESKDVAYASFGKAIIADDAIAASSMAKHYNDLKTGDSLDTKMVATVNEVCQAKGCWMTLKLEDSSEVLVKFKDYGFFVPKNIAGKEVVVNGKAFVSETSVAELRHYAEDAGKTAEEIAAITEPERTFSFEADGVLVKE